MNAKKKCCWLTAVLIFALAVGLLPATAFAAGSPQVQLNGQAMVSGVEVVCGEGTALFDEAAKTLTLENATIEETTNQNVAALFIQGELTIRLIGNNRIAAQDKRAIYAQNADLTIQGTSADCLTLESNGETLQADQSQVTIDGCVIRASSHRWGGILAYGGTMTIQNGANITIDSQDPALVGENGLTITDSAVTATAGAQVNAVSTYGPLIVRNSTLQVTGLDATAYPAIYAAGDILIEANSTVTSLSNGMRGIYAEANMTVNDSTVTASGATNEGVIVVGTLTVNRSVLTASSKPNDIIPAIVTQHLHITDSRVTANGGLALMDWNNGTTDNCSFSITPGAGELVQFKVDPTNWNGATAVHFDKQGQSPYDTTVDFDDNAMNWLGSYRYVQVDEHVHAGGTATCQSPAVCADCGRSFGSTDPNHHATVVKTPAKDATCTENGNTDYWHCEACGKFFDSEALVQEISLEQTVILAKGHGETELKNVRAATCTAMGYTGDKVCKVCGAVIEPGVATAKLAHNYQNGACTACGAADPNYQAAQNTASSNLPQTGDNTNTVLWMVLLCVSGLGLAVLAVYNQKKKHNG